MSTAPSPNDAFGLAEQYERLRFAIEHQLSADTPTLRALEVQLLATAPEHPFALNLRAGLALPETLLPPPPHELRPAARALMDGDLPRALAEATRADRSGSAVVSCAIGDLLLCQGRPNEAEERFQHAYSMLGPLPPLLTRLGRTAELLRNPTDAWSLTVQALAANPLWGTARWQLRRLGEAQGLLLAPLPLRVLDEAESGPWRALRQRWRSDGLEDAWRWTERLNPSNADEFRAWHLENNEALRRFFDEGLIRDPG